MRCYIFRSCFVIFHAIDIPSNFFRLPLHRIGMEIIRNFIGKSSSISKALPTRIPRPMNRPKGFIRLLTDKLHNINLPTIRPPHRINR